MTGRRIPVHVPALEDCDREAVAACLAGGWISSEGPQVAEFERRFAAGTGRRHGVAVSSGTAALDVALRALGLGAGDEVLVPTLTIISCARAILECGATPVPVDCDGEDWNAHLAHFEARTTPRTRALMLVPLYGLCADHGALVAWARERGLRVVEDASQALGVDCGGRPCGSFGDVAVFSLYANKVVTTGEGGMILCDDEAFAARCRSLRNLCFDPARRFHHEEIGWNYRLTAMQAALGSSQLARLPELARRRRAAGLVYRGGLAGVDALRPAPDARPWAQNGYWVFGLVVAPEAPFSRDELTGELARQGIDTRPFFWPLHRQPALLRDGRMAACALPTAESLAARGFYLPGGFGLPAADQERVIEAVCRFVESRT